MKDSDEHILHETYKNAFNSILLSQFDFFKQTKMLEHLLAKFILIYSSIHHNNCQIIVFCKLYNVIRSMPFIGGSGSNTMFWNRRTNRVVLYVLKQTS